MADEYTQDYTGNGEDQYQESMEVGQGGDGEMSEGQTPGDRINASKNDDDERLVDRNALSPDAILFIFDGRQLFWLSSIFMQILNEPVMQNMCLLCGQGPGSVYLLVNCILLV